MNSISLSPIALNDDDKNILKMNHYMKKSETRHKVNKSGIKSPILNNDLNNSKQNVFDSYEKMANANYHSNGSQSALGYMKNKKPNVIIDDSPNEL